MIRKEKIFELMNFFYNPFKHIWFKSVFNPKITDFENVA
jgi:hypothetical protein